jgi:hypothetical protein
VTLFCISKKDFHKFAIISFSLIFLTTIAADRLKKKMSKKKVKTRKILKRVAPTKRELTLLLLILFGVTFAFISVPFICVILLLAGKRDPRTSRKRRAERSERSSIQKLILQVPVTRVLPNFRHIYNMFLNADKESYKRRNLKTILINMRGILQSIYPSTDMDSQYTKLANLESIVKSENPDILVLTETNIPGHATRNKIDNSDLQRALRG